MKGWVTALLLLLSLGTASAQIMPGRGGGIGNLVGARVSCTDGQVIKAQTGIGVCAADAGAGTGAPAAAKYITQTIDGGLSDEQSLGLLTTGLVLNTVTAGTGVLSAYAGAAAVTNQFLSSLSASGVATHRAIVAADISNGLITDVMVATANKDGVAGTASMRTLGSGAQTAAAGNDGRFPTAGEKAALAGSTGTPGSGNKYLTQDYLLGVLHGPGVPLNQFSVFVDQLTSTDDNMPLGEATRAVRIVQVACRYRGSTPTTGPIIALKKGDGTTGFTAMTHTTPTCVGPGASLSWQAVTNNAGSNVAAGLQVVFDVTNTPNPDASQGYTIVATFEVTD